MGTIGTPEGLTQRAHGGKARSLRMYGRHAARDASFISLLTRGTPDYCISHSQGSLVSALLLLLHDHCDIVTCLGWQVGFPVLAADTDRALHCTRTRIIGRQGFGVIAAKLLGQLLHETCRAVQ